MLHRAYLNAEHYIIHATEHETQFTLHLSLTSWICLLHCLLLTVDRHLLYLAEFSCIPVFHCLWLGMLVHRGMMQTGKQSSW